LSAAFFVPVFIQYIQTGLVERFPTLIVCGFVMLTAMFLFIEGTILATLRVKDKQDFEHKLHEISMWKQLKK
jgi:hypothetical protein